MTAPALSPRVVVSVLLLLSSGVRAVATNAEAANGIPGMDAAFLQESMAVGRLVEKGPKAEASAAVDTFHDKTALALYAARIRAADLSLRRTNPFVSGEARKAAGAEFEEARKEVARLVLNYAAMIQVQPDFLASLGRSVSDGVKNEAKVYQGIRATYGTLNLAMMGELTAKPPADGVEHLTSAAFAQLMEAQIHGSPQESSRNLDRVIAESRTKLLPVSKNAAEIQVNALDFVPVFLSVTRDHDTAEQVLSAALNGNATNVRAWAARAESRMAVGDGRGTLIDLLIAKALAPDDPAFLAAFQHYNEIPKFADRVYQEPYNELEAAAAKLEQMQGGTMSSRGARAADAARRNAGRRIYACGFMDNPQAIRVGVKWVLEHHKENTDILTPDYLADTKALGNEFNAAKTAGDNLGMLAVFDQHAAMVALAPAFWKTRIAALYTMHQAPPAAAALTVASVLDPDAAWLPEFRKAISEALDAKPAPSAP